MTTRRRWALTFATIVALAASFAAASFPAPAQTVDGVTTADLSVRMSTMGAAGGPFNFELSDGAASPLVQRGVATTTAEDTAIDIADLGGDLAPATYTLRQDLAQLPAEPAGGQWAFTSVECEGATVEVDAPTATATITLEPGATATCIVTDTWAADGVATTSETIAPNDADDATEDDAAAAELEQVEVPPPPDDVVVPLAIAPLDCSGGTIYQIQRASTGATSAKLNAVVVGPMSGTNPVNATQVSVPLQANTANALGITPGGQGAWALAPQQPGGTGNTLIFTLYSFSVATEVWTPHTATIDTTGRLPAGVSAESIRNGGIVAGAVDPLSGNYYWASLANAGVGNSMTIFGWNTTTNTAIGVVANSTWPEDNPGSGGTNGDIAFDRIGNLYVVSSVQDEAATGVIPGPLPTTQQTPTPTLTDTRLAEYANPNERAFNGIAFDNTGSLFIQASAGADTQILKINPSTGAILAGPSVVSFTPTGGGIGVDLAACSNPPTLQLQKNVINRQADTDQFNLAITGGGLSSGNTATTSGTANGVQPQSAGPVLGTTGQTYTFTETAAGTTNLANYTTTYQCVDRGAGNVVVTSGTGTTFSVALPAPGPTQTGQSFLCTFTNSAPRLVVTKSASPVSTTPVAEGQLITYTLTFNNSAGGQPATVNYTDNLARVLDDATVTTPPALATGTGLTVGPISGTSFPVTGTLAARATATVTFSVTVNTPDTGDHQLDNFVVPTGTTPPAQCLPTNPACTTHPVPALVVSKSAVPVSTTPVAEGQLITYTLTFANTAGRAPATVNHTDNLSSVLDDATVVTPPALATGTGLTVSGISGGAFTVTGAVPAGTTATVTFSVRVNTPDTGDHQLDNFVVPTGTTPPATCVPTTPPTCTTHPVPALVVSKSAVPVSTTPVAEGQLITYTLTFANTAGRAPATVNHTDNLSRVFDDATVTTAPALASGSGLTVGAITGGAFTITGTIAAGATATVTFAVTVNTPDTGDHQLDNFVVPTGTTPPATCVPTTPPTCTTHPVPALVVSKSAVPVSTTPVAEGQLITYTLTFANTAGRAPATVNHTDNLSRVLDDATVTTPPALASGTGLTVSGISGGAFTVTGAVPAGTTATVTFAVTVNTPDTGDHQLDNFVVPTGTTPPATCVPTTPPTCTTHPVPALVVSKSAVPSSTTPVAEGQVLTYTLTFANTAGRAPATVNHTDNLSRVLDDATVTTPPALASGTGLTVGAITAGAFTITGTVAAGQTATVTFSVTVNTPDTGDHQLDNFVVPTGTTPPAQCLPTNPACTTHPVPALVVTKSASPASTTTVNEGNVVTYTLTFANAAGRAPATVNYTDDLSRVLDDATVTTLPALASGTGLTVGAITGGAFTVTGTIAAGATATVTFSVTVNTPDTGDHQLDNFVVPTGTTPPPNCLPTNPACTTHPVPALVVTKSSSPVSTTPVAEGQVLTYTLTFANTAGRAPAPVNYTDNLSRVLDDATVTTPPALASGTGLTVGTITAGAFSITGTVAAGATATVTFAVTVNTPDTGDHQLDNFVVPTGTPPPAECLPTDPRCTTNPVPALVVTKSAVPSSTTTVNEGNVVTYTLTFANTAGRAPATVNHTDDLSRVLDDATVTTPPALASGAGLTVGTITGGAFTITGTVAAGATATVTFAVTVNTPDTGDHQLDNFVVPTGTTPPPDCLPTDPTCTTNPVPALVVTKSASPVSTTPVAEGQVLTYTLTFANTAGRAPAPVNYTDDLSRVLDDATVTTPPALATGSGLIVGPISGTTFPITGTVAAGATATVTFSVTVNTPDTGDHQLDNFVVPTGTPPPAECLPTDPRCTTNPVPALVVTKSAVPASTTTVNEGDVVAYTLTFANTAGRAPATVNHTDNLSRVLDDATVTTPPALASGAGLTVGAITAGAFSITGTVAAGATATVTFSVTVNTPDTGDHQLDNFVVPTGTTPPSECLATDPACTTNPVPALVVTKSAVPPSTTPVNEGDVITYTLTFANTAGRAPAPVDYTDNLSRVLDDATVTTPPALASGTGLTVGAISGGTFTITGTVAAGTTATVTFSVTVGSPNIGDRQLDNFVIPTGDTPPPECLPTDPTCTTHPAPALFVTKSSSPVSTTPVAEGQVLTYTLTFTNTRGRAPALVNHTDDLSRVLDDATVTTSPALASGTGLTVGAISGGTFTVTGAVAAGATATVTFAVTVNTPDTGDHQLDNFVVPTGTDPPEECLPTDPACTTNPVPALVVSKSVVPASTTPVNEGQVLAYTLTFDNTVGRAPATVNHTDDLSRVLDDATLTTQPALATGTGLTVSPINGGAFTITGSLAGGSTATVTFSVTVNRPDTGDHQLDNFIVPTGTTPPTECVPGLGTLTLVLLAEISTTCTTNPVPALVVTKSADPPSTTTVNEGQELTYTLTFANTAGRAPAPVDYTDDLTKVLDDATVTTQPALASGSGLTVGAISGATFPITGAVEAGATATVTLRVRVNAPDTGDRRLDNFVVPTGTDPPSECLSANRACTTNPVPGPNPPDPPNDPALPYTGSTLRLVFTLAGLLILGGASALMIGRRYRIRR